MKRVFIFSLPRSGSAWLSVFLSGGNAHFDHEPTADCTPDAWAAASLTRGYEVIGAVDTGAFLNPDPVFRALPHAQFLALRRDPGAIQESCRGLGLDQFDAYPARKILDRLISSYALDCIDYERLTDIDYLRDIWLTVFASEFDERRATLLMEMMVERDLDKFLKARPHLQ